MAYVPQLEEPAEVIGAGAGPPEGAVDHVQRRFLRAGSILLAAGWLVLTHAIGNSSANVAGGHAVGLALLLLGVFQVMLSPVADLFPGAARVGAAVADAVLFYLFAPAGN